MHLQTLFYTALAVLLVPPASILPGSRRSDQNLVSAGLPIPIYSKKCTSDAFDPRDANASVEAAIAHFGGEDEEQGVRVQYRLAWGEAKGSALFYVCNCRACSSIGFPESEIREAVRIIEEDCGPGQGGWVWSLQWDKGWALRPAHVMGGATIGIRHICPMSCIADIYESDMDCELASGGNVAIPV